MNPLQKPGTLESFQDWVQKHVFSVSEFEAYQKCPYRFYAQSYLRIMEEESRDIEMTPSETGQLLHAILEVFLKGESTLLASEASGNLKEKEGLLLTLMEDEIANLRKKRPELSSVLLERKKKRISRTLLSFLEDYMDKRNEKTLKPAYLEWTFGKDSPPLVVDHYGKKIPIKGRIDRIDVDPVAKRFLVIDYKTGSGKTTGNQIRAGEALQLPLYIMAVQELLLPDYEPIGGLYYSLADMTKSDGILHMERLPDQLELHPRSSSLVPPQEWDAVFEKNKRMIADIHEAILREEFPSQEKACDFNCPYEDVCKVRSYWA